MLPSTLNCFTLVVDISFTKQVKLLGSRSLNTANKFPSSTLAFVCPTLGSSNLAMERYAKPRRIRQLVTLTSDIQLKPTSWEEIKDGEFYIINGQYNVAASRLITQVGSGVEEDVKSDFRVWSCFIVWLSDPEILQSISVYYNQINHFQMIQPSWATNILGARTVWVSMGSLENPSQITAVGTTAARRATDVQSQTRRFKVRKSDRVNLMFETRSPEPLDQLKLS